MAMDVQGSDSLFWATGLDTQGFKTGKHEIEGLISGLAKNITATDVFAGLALSAAVVFSVMSAKAYAFSKEYQTTMKEVQTISAEVQKNYEAYSQALVDMSRRLPETAIGLTKAYYQVVSAGYDGADGLAVLEAASKGAVAGVTSTLVAVDGLTTVLNSYRIEATRSNEVMDMMFKTVEKGKTTFPELASRIALVAPLASSTGIAFEQLLAATATLTKQGTPTAEAFTQIRASIIALNETFGDGWAQTMSYQDALQKLYTIAKGSQNKMREMVGSVEALNAVLAIAGDNFESSVNDLDAITNSAGAASAAYATMAETATNQFAILHNNVIAKLKPLGDGLLSLATGIAKGLNLMLGETTSFAEEMIQRNYEYIATVEKEKSSLEDMVGQLEKLEQGTRDYKEIEEQLVAFLGDDMVRVLDDATGSMNAYGVAKERIIELDKEMLTARKEILSSEIDMIRIEQERLEIGEAETAMKLSDLTRQRDELERDIEATAAQFARDEIKDASGTSPVARTFEQQEALAKGYEKLKKEYYDLLTAGDKIMTETGLSYRKLALQIREAEMSLVLTEKKLNYELQSKREALKGVTEALRNYGVEQTKVTAATAKRKTAPILGVISDTSDYSQTKENEAYTHYRTITNQKLAIFKWSIDEQEALEQGLYLSISKMTDDELKNFIVNARAKMQYIESNSELYLLWIEKIQAAEEEWAERERQHFENLARSVDVLGDFLSTFDTNLTRVAGDVSDLISSVNSLAHSTGDPFSDFGSGVSIATAYISIMKTLFAGSVNPNQKYIDQMKELNRQTQEQIDLLRRLNGEEALSGIIDVYRVLNTEIETNLDAIRNIKTYSKTGQFTGRTLGDLFTDDQLLNDLKLGSDVLKEDKKLYTDLINEINDARETLLSYQEEYRQIVTNTTAEAIASSIAQGFSEGLDEAEIFADTMEDLLRSALVSAFERRIITDYMNDFYAEFYGYLESGGQLTADEIAQLAASLQVDIAAAGQSWEAIKKVLEQAGFDLVDSIGEETTSGLAGAISGITEKTAGLIEGQLNAVRIDILKGLALNTIMLSHIQGIASNTGYLDDIFNKSNLSLNALREIRDYSYYLDDVFKRLDLSLNALRDIRDYSYYLDDIYRAIPRIDMTPMLDRMDDMLDVNRQIATNTLQSAELLRAINLRMTRTPTKTTNSAAFPDADALRAMGV